MRKKILFLLLALHLCASAQELKKVGKSIEELVPSGWTVTHAKGDLNKDGLPDMAIVAIPDFEEHLQKRDDDYVYNFNQPVLAIYFGTSQGEYRLWKQYDDVLEARESEYIDVNYQIGINERGSLRIDKSVFAIAGSWSSEDLSYVYRFQNNDFYLIGMEENIKVRNTGENTLISYNYLTHKRQKVVSNMFDENVKPKEKWSSIPKEPLKKLADVDM